MSVIIIIILSNLYSYWYQCYYHYYYEQLVFVLLSVLLSLILLATCIRIVISVIIIVPVCNLYSCCYQCYYHYYYEQLVFVLLSVLLLSLLLWATSIFEIPHFTLVEEQKVFKNNVRDIYSASPKLCIFFVLKLSHVQLYTLFLLYEYIILLSLKHILSVTLFTTPS